MELPVATDGSEERDRALASVIDIATATDGSIAPRSADEPAISDTGSEPVRIADARDRSIVDSLDAAAMPGQARLDESVEAAPEEGRGDQGLLYGNRREPERITPSRAGSMASTSATADGPNGRGGAWAAWDGTASSEPPPPYHAGS